MNLQIGTAFTISTIFGIVYYFLEDANLKAGKNGDSEKSRNISIFSNVYSSLVFFLPILYTVYVTILIWCRGYIPSVSGATTRDRAMRELTFYLFRVIVIFVGIWTPNYFLLVSASWWEQYWGLVLVWCLGGIQPILTTCMILTKTDARKYIWDLVALSYLFGDCACRKDKALPVVETKNTGAWNTTKFSRRPGDVSIHGFYFPNAESNANTDANADVNASADDYADDSADAVISNDDDNEGDGNDNGDAAAGVQVSTSRRNQTRWITILGTGEIVRSVSKIKYILNVGFVPADYVCAYNIVVSILYLFLAIRCAVLRCDLCLLFLFFFLVESFRNIHLVLVDFFQRLAISDHVRIAVEVDHDLR